MALAGSQLFNSGIYGPPEGQGCDFFGDGSGKLLFRFDNTITDTCGYYLNNYQSSDLLYTTDAKFGEYSFGPSGYINGNSVSGIAQGTLAARNSASVWVKAPSYGYKATIFEIDNFMLYFNGNQLYGVYGIGSGSGALYGSFVHNMSVNEWHHLAIVISGSTNMKIYVDNVLRLNLDNGNPPREPWKPAFNIGSNSFNFMKFNGQIDQFRVFNRTLSASEVTALYNES